jgi:hypothetical protein
VGQSQDLAERLWNEHMKRMADAGAMGGAMAGQLISGCSIWRNSRSQHPTCPVTAHGPPLTRMTQDLGTGSGKLIAQALASSVLRY